MPGIGEIKRSGYDANCKGFCKSNHRRDLADHLDDNPFRDMDSRDWYIAVTILAALVGFLVVVMLIDMYRKYKQGELKRELWGIFRSIFILPFVGLYTLIFRVIPGLFFSIPRRCAAWKADRAFAKKQHDIQADGVAKEKGKETPAADAAADQDRDQDQDQDREREDRLTSQPSTDAAHDEFMRSFGDVPVKDTPKWNIYQKVMARRAMKRRDVESQ